MVIFPGLAVVVHPFTLEFVTITLASFLVANFCVSCAILVTHPSDTETYCPKQTESPKNRILISLCVMYSFSDNSH